jgi:hypothetical protein
MALMRQFLLLGRKRGASNVLTGSCDLRATVRSRSVTTHGASPVDADKFEASTISHAVNQLKCWHVI